MSWLRQLFGGSNSEVPGDQPARETVRHLIARGGSVRPFELNDVSPQYRDALMAVCRANTEVAALWLGWVSVPNGPDELLLNLRLDSVSETAIRAFMAGVNALGGPSCVAAVSNGTPKSDPFYVRADAARQWCERNEPGSDEICIQCGHPFNPHRFHGFAPSPTEGWIDCPVEGCTCKGTWRMAPGEARKILFRL